MTYRSIVAVLCAVLAALAVSESLGLAGWGYHAKNEYIEIDSIVPRLYLSTRLLGELARE